jgi:hypothetical protein
MKHQITFIKSGRGKARCPPDPAYPHGIKIGTDELPNCEVQLPYPAPECGQYVIRCLECHTVVAVTAAGRPDDPVLVTIPCEPKTTS